MLQATEHPPSTTRAIIIAILAWLSAALVLGAFGVFRSLSANHIAVVVSSLTGVSCLLCWFVESVRHWVTTVPAKALVAPHLTRFVGIYFLFLSRHGDLPAAFAEPAGFGDIAVAAAALLLVIAPVIANSRGLLLLWNSVGLLDLLFVVVIARRVGTVDWQSMAALRQMPLTLLPSFLVPLLITSHVAIFFKLLRPKAA